MMAQDPTERIINEANLTVSRILGELSQVHEQIINVPDYLGQEVEHRLKEVRLHIQDSITQLTEASKRLWISVGTPPEVFRSTPLPKGPAESWARSLRKMTEM